MQLYFVSPQNFELETEQKDTASDNGLEDENSKESSEQTVSWDRLISLLIDFVHRLISLLTDFDFNWHTFGYCQSPTVFTFQEEKMSEKKRLVPSPHKSCVSVHIRDRINMWRGNQLVQNTSLLSPTQFALTPEEKSAEKWRLVPSTHVQHVPVNSSDILLEVHAGS